MRHREPCRVRSRGRMRPAVACPPWFGCGIVMDGDDGGRTAEAVAWT